MDLRQRRYRPIANQQRQQYIPEKNQQQQKTSEEPLQIQEMAQYVQDLLQNGISTDFIYDRSKLMLFLMVIVIIGFYIFLVGNLKAEANVRNLPNSHNAKEIIINGSKKINQTQLTTQNFILNHTKLEKSQFLVQNQMQDKNKTKILNHKDKKQETKFNNNTNQQALKII